MVSSCIVLLPSQPKPRLLGKRNRVSNVFGGTFLNTCHLGVKVASDQGRMWHVSSRFHLAHKMTSLEDDDIIVVLSKLATIIYLSLEGIM